MDLMEFVARHPPRPPAKPPANEDELRHLGPPDGVRFLRAPPPEADERRVPARKGDPGCHLWVIDGSGMELGDVVAAVEQMGYTVVGSGWDTDVGRPAMVLRRWGGEQVHGEPVERHGGSLLEETMGR